MRNLNATIKALEGERDTLKTQKELMEGQNQQLKLDYKEENAEHKLATEKAQEKEKELKTQLAALKAQIETENMVQSQQSKLQSADKNLTKEVEKYKTRYLPIICIKVKLFFSNLMLCNICARRSEKLSKRFATMQKDLKVAKMDISKVCVSMFFVQAIFNLTATYFQYFCSCKQKLKC